MSKIRETLKIFGIPIPNMLVLARVSNVYLELKFFDNMYENSLQYPLQTASFSPVF